MRRRKIRKFADNQADKQTQNSSNTDATLILCGSSGERANKYPFHHIIMFTKLIAGNDSEEYS